MNNDLLRLKELLELSERRIGFIEDILKKDHIDKSDFLFLLDQTMLLSIQSKELLTIVNCDLSLEKDIPSKL